MTCGCRKSGTRRLGLDRARTAAAGSAVIAARKGIRPSEQHVRVVVSRPALVVLGPCGGTRTRFARAARRCTRTLPGLVYYHWSPMAFRPTTDWKLPRPASREIGVRPRFP